MGYDQAPGKTRKHTYTDTQTDLNSLKLSYFFFKLMNISIFSFLTTGYMLCNVLPTRNFQRYSQMINFYTVKFVLPCEFRADIRGSRRGATWARALLELLLATGCRSGCLFTSLKNTQECASENIPTE